MLPQFFIMTDLGLTPYVDPGPLVPLEKPWMPWLFPVMVGIGALLLLVVFLKTVWYLCCFKPTAPVLHHQPRVKAGASSACSAHLPLSRYPKTGVDLATFVTRRSHTWREDQLRGRDCWLILD